MKWRPFLIVFLALFIFFVLIMAFFVGFGAGVGDAIAHPEKYDPKLSKDSVKTEDPIKFVKASTVINATYPVSINSLGRVSSSQSISVSAEVQGVLRKGNVSLKKGASFRKGQVLFRINNGDAALLLKARKSSYLNLLATTLPDIKIDYPAHYDVWKLFFDNVDMDRSLPPMPPLVDNKLKTLLASRNILGEYYNIKADQIKLSKYTVVAPFNGTITDAFADEGSIVNPGGAVVNIINNGSLEVECPVSPEEVDLVKIGSKVSLSDDKNSSWTGTVIRKGQYLNPNTQSIPVFIQLDASKDEVYNGMYMEVSIVGDSIANVFEVPRRSLIENTGNVYAIQDSTLSKRPVDLVLVRDRVVLLGGLKNGEVLVTEPLISPDQINKVVVIENAE